MPLEGHWARQNAPVLPRSTRERRVWAVLVAALAATVLAIAIPAALHHAAPPAAGCVDLTVASTTGGATMHACGERARALCAAPPALPAPEHARLVARCRDIGAA